jgi:hypothetical protein
MSENVSPDNVLTQEWEDLARVWRQVSDRVAVPKTWAEFTANFSALFSDPLLVSELQYSPEDRHEDSLRVVRYRDFHEEVNRVLDGWIEREVLDGAYEVLVQRAQDLVQSVSDLTVSAALAPFGLSAPIQLWQKSLEIGAYGGVVRRADEATLTSAERLRVRALPQINGPRHRKKAMIRVK